MTKVTVTHGAQGSAEPMPRPVATARMSPKAGPLDELYASNRPIGHPLGWTIRPHTPAVGPRVDAAGRPY